MKLTYKTLFSKPVYQRGQNGPVLAGYEFMAAFDKLRADPLTVKEHRQLALCAQKLAEERKAFEEAQLAIYKQFGIPEVTLLQARLEELKANLDTAPLPNVVRKEIGQVEEALRAASPGRAGHRENYYPPTDARALVEFNRAFEELFAEEIDLPLDHKIKLSEDSKLNGLDQEPLLEILAEL